MQTLEQEIYIILKQYCIKKKERYNQIAGLFLPDTTAQACLHHIAEHVKKWVGENK